MASLVKEGTVPFREWMGEVWGDKKARVIVFYSRTQGDPGQHSFQTHGLLHVGQGKLEF